MRSEYTLVKDIISGHNERMNNIKKYYPFFRISDIFNSLQKLMVNLSVQKSKKSSRQ